MIVMLLRYLAPALAGVGLGWWIGVGMERAEWVDFTKNLTEETAEAAREAEQANDARIAALRNQHELDIAEYRRILEETERSEQNARRIARTLREDIDDLRTEFAGFRARFTGDSACRFDPTDIRVLNDAVQAVNRGRDPGVPDDPDTGGP